MSSAESSASASSNTTRCSTITLPSLKQQTMGTLTSVLGLSDKILSKRHIKLIKLLACKSFLPTEGWRWWHLLLLPKRVDSTRGAAITYNDGSSLSSCRRTCHDTISIQTHLNYYVLLDRVDEIDCHWILQIVILRLPCGLYSHLHQHLICSWHTHACLLVACWRR